MAEFKISSELSGEVEALKSAGKALAQDYKEVESGDVQTLKTSMAYINRQKNIHNLLKAYQALLLKDANDLNEMIKGAQEMDETISKTIK